MKTHPNEPAYPIVGEAPGLTKLEHFAALASDDFDKLNIADQQAIAGDIPTFEIGDGIHTSHGSRYVNWLMKGRARWKVLQAQALIQYLNKED